MPYKGNEKNLLSHKEHGYYLLAPHSPLKIDGKELSGTQVRILLGHPDNEKNREKKIKKIIDFFDKLLFYLI